MRRRRAAPTATTTTSTPRRRSPTRTGAPVLLHPADRMLWDAVAPATGRRTRELADGQTSSTVGGVELARAAHARATRPGACCLHVRDARACVFTGDTLFKGGPGATGRSFSDFATIIVDPRPPADAAGRHRRPHRPRRPTTIGTRRPTSRSGSPGVTERAADPAQPSVAADLLVGLVQSPSYGARDHAASPRRLASTRGGRFSHRGSPYDMVVDEVHHVTHAAADDDQLGVEQPTEDTDHPGRSRRHRTKDVQGGGVALAGCRRDDLAGHVVGIARGEVIQRGAARPGPRRALAPDSVLAAHAGDGADAVGVADASMDPEERELARGTAGPLHQPAVA